MGLRIRCISTSLIAENLWHSDLIDVADAGIMVVSLEGDGQGSHAIGFRDGIMHVSDPILVSQLYASAEVVEVWFCKADAAVAIVRAIHRQDTPQTPVSIHENTSMTHKEIENLKARLVNEIMSSLSAQLGAGQVYG